jgi:large subunit ribosomal protein L17
MNRNKSGRKFGRERGARRALLKSLANALILRGKILTTETKARELRVYIEPIITKAKSATVSCRRLAEKKLSPGACKKLFSSIAPRYKEVHGGYTRLIKHSPRKTDAAKLAIIELLGFIKSMQKIRFLGV